MLADRTGYNVVELSDNYKVPKVLATPVVEKEEPVENFDFTRYYYGNELYSIIVSCYITFCGCRVLFL